VIAFNSSGVRVANLTDTVGNTISANWIFLNKNLGIDLGLGYTIPNDVGDADTGANNQQNFPVITSAINTLGPVDIAGTLNSTANTQYRIEFFASTECDSSGYGEGRDYIGTTMVVTDGAGNASFNVNFSAGGPLGQFITATATDPAGSTSEFSPCALITLPNLPLPTMSIANVSQAEGNNGQKALDFTVTLSAPSNKTVTATYFTLPGTATKDVDYKTAGGNLVFGHGETSKKATILVNGDKEDEADENFFVQLSAQNNATLAKPQAVGTIINDDDP
jgi:hypothetical protein